LPLGWLLLCGAAESLAWLGRSETAAVPTSAKTATTIPANARRRTLGDELRPISFACFLIKLSLVKYVELKQDF
jgi:hypothetical protein